MLLNNKALAAPSLLTFHNLFSLGVLPGTHAAKEGLPHLIHMISARLVAVVENLADVCGARGDDRSVHHIQNCSRLASVKTFSVRWTPEQPALSQPTASDR